jgi:6-phosphogluconolactonase
VQRNLGRVDVFSNSHELAEALADLFVNVAREAFAQRGSFTVALAGGTTPRAAYDLLARAPFIDEVSWADTHVYFGDERCVEPTDPLSNYLMAREALLLPADVPDANVHRMRGEDPPDRAARAYADLLRGNLGDAPQFDLVMLGLGTDAHTASLFPGVDPLTDNDALVRHTYSQATLTDRLSITPKVINNARTVVIAAEGSTKAQPAHDVRDGAYDPTAHPAQIVSPTNGELIWLLDSLAAGMLKTR